MKYTFKEIGHCPFCEGTDFKLLGKRLNHSQGLNPHKKRGITASIVKCKKCELIFPNPMPIPSSLGDHYDLPPEEYWKPEYINLNKNYLNGLINWMNTIQPVPKGAKILDIGAGLGKAMLALENNGYDAYGIEPSESFYKNAIEKMGVNKEKLILSAVEDCNFETETFDVILLTAVLEHLYEPAQVIIKAMSWLKPDGLLFIEVPSSGWLINKIYNSIIKLKGMDYVGNLSPMHEPYHLFEFSRKSFELHSQKNDYEIADFRHYICQTYMPKILDPMLKWYMKKTDTGMELAIWLRKRKV